MPHAVGDLCGADRLHGNFQPGRKRLGIGQKFAREFDLAARSPAEVEPLEQPAR